MGKEVKIGLAVILSLVIVLGVVLARRLTTSNDAPENDVAGAEETKPSKSRGSRWSWILRNTQTVWARILVFHRFCRCQASRTFKAAIWKRSVS